jgi:hypothetical protein
MCIGRNQSDAKLGPSFMADLGFTTDPQNGDGR